jgi:hypothetical protein
VFKLKKKIFVKKEINVDEILDKLKINLNWMKKTVRDFINKFEEA